MGRGGKVTHHPVLRALYIHEHGHCDHRPKLVSFPSEGGSFKPRAPIDSIGVANGKGDGRQKDMTHTHTHTHFLADLDEGTYQLRSGAPDYTT